MVRGPKSQKEAVTFVASLLINELDNLPSPSKGWTDAQKKRYDIALQKVENMLRKKTSRKTCPTVEVEAEQLTVEDEVGFETPTRSVEPILKGVF